MEALLEKKIDTDAIFLLTIQIHTQSSGYSWIYLLVKFQLRIAQLAEFAWFSVTFFQHSRYIFSKHFVVLVFEIYMLLCGVCF